MDGPGSLLRRLAGLSPLAVDSGLAVALAVLTLIELSTLTDCPCVTTSHLWWTAGFLLLQTLPLALRRRYPFTVVNVVGLSAGVFNILGFPLDPYTPVFGIMLAVYSAAAHARRPLAIATGVIALVALVVVHIPEFGVDEFGAIADDFFLIGGAWIVGDNMRRRWREAELLRERAERAEREREERARTAALQERARIAREIHDVVAHSVSVIAVQAGAARTVVREQPERASEALASIERVSRETMAELRRALGVLRAPEGQAALSPQPRLDRLDDLVDEFRGAGLSVQVATAGEPHDLSDALDLSAYRVVQEALTNTLKHSGASTATVEVRYLPDELEVVVTDDGDGVTTSTVPGGQGLIGMRERVAAFGGTLEAGPAGGGFAVRARFPLTDGEAAP